MNCTHTMFINAPVAKVFSLVDDEKNLKRWMDGLEETIFPEGYERAKSVGTKFKQRIREGARVNEYDGEVIAYDKPHHLAILLGNKHFTVRVDYRFTADRLQTRLDYQSAMIRSSWFVNLMCKLFAGFTRRLLNKQMQKLKELAELPDNPYQSAPQALSAAR
ncbi:MAG: SRPBCC family protein [Acidobacteria bacterium]|nr:SRPBCC family protein [Acidobacteriota bacterium]